LVDLFWTVVPLALNFYLLFFTLSSCRGGGGGGGGAGCMLSVAAGIRKD